MLHLRYTFMHAGVSHSSTALSAHQEKAACNISVSSQMGGQVLQSSTGQQMANKIYGFNYAPA